MKTCCEGFEFYKRCGNLEEDYRDNTWTATCDRNSKLTNIRYCPWCGEKVGT